MSRYYFHLHECGSVTIDEDGLELADLVAAERMAVLSARDIMSAEVRNGRLCLSCHIAVTDDAQREVLRVAFREAVIVSGL